MLSRLLINRQFANIWFAGAISWIGDFVFDTTALLWISTVLAKDEPWAPAAASGVLIAVLVPSIVFGPLAGVYVDRWDPKRTMLGSDLIRALLMSGLIILPMLPAGTVPVVAQLAIIYTIVVLSTVVGQFFTPARFTVIADIVPEADQPRAAGITQGTSAAAAIVGPPLAAPLLFTVGVQWALIVNALSFLLSFVFILGARVPRAAKRPVTEEKTGFWVEFLVGLRTILNTPIVLSMVIMGIIANIAAQVFNALGVFFVINNLHTEARFFGFQETMMGVGAIIGAAVAGWLGTRLGLGRTIWVSMVLFGVFLAIYTRMSNFLLALGVLLLAAIPLGSMNTAASPLLIRAVPREVLGRVFATFVPAIRSMSIAGVAVAGWLSSSVLYDLDAKVLGVHFGTYDTIIFVGSLLVIASGIYGMFVLRNADKAVVRDPDPEPEQATSS